MKRARSLDSIDFGRLQKCLAALSDPTRQKVVSLLAGERLNVTELTERLALSQPAISHHLKTLVNAGILTQQRVGRERVYRLDTACCEGLADQFREFITRCCASARCC